MNMKLTIEKEPMPETIAKVLRHLARIKTPAKRRASRENLKKARAKRWPTKA